MKTIFYTLFLILFSVVSHAQSYELTTSTEEYNNIQSQFQINDGEIWDDSGFTINLFPFEFFGEPIEVLYIQDDGYGSQIGTQPSTDFEFSLMDPFGLDIVDKGFNGNQSLSPIHYELSGAAGNGICKIEWNNAGFYNNVNSGNATDFINFQIWIYQASGIIEFRYGSSDYDDSLEDIDFGDEDMVYLVKNINGDLFDEAIVLGGDPADPIVTTIYNVNEEFQTLLGIPTEGTVYRFSPTSTSTADLELEAQLILFPNPTGNSINIQSHINIKNYRLTDLLGSELRSFNENCMEIDMSKLQNGMYLLHLSAENGGEVTKSILKK